MKKLTPLISIFFLLLFMSSCTEQRRARKWGGTTQINLPKGKKLINITWKDSNIWYLTRDMTLADSAQTYEFSESSSWGMMNGTITITEQK